MSAEVQKKKKTRISTTESAWRMFCSSFFCRVLLKYFLFFILKYIFFLRVRAAAEMMKLFIRNVTRWRCVLFRRISFRAPYPFFHNAPRRRRRSCRRPGPRPGRRRGSRHSPGGVEQGRLAASMRQALTVLNFALDAEMLPFSKVNSKPKERVVSLININPP